MKLEVNYFESNDRYLIVDSSNLEELLSFIKVNKIENIAFMKAHGYFENNINCLSKTPGVKKIFLGRDLSKIDIQGLLHLKGLTSLICGINPLVKIDLSSFKYLNHLSINHHDNWLKVNRIENLLDLTIFKGRFETLENELMNSNLETLRIYNSKIISLKGMGELKNLVCFEGEMLPKLEFLDFDYYSNKLESFHLYNCKKVNHLTFLKSVSSIVSLRLAQCGKFSDNDFMKNMVNLKEVRFPKTKFETLNKSYFEGIEKVFPPQLLK